MYKITNYTLNKAKDNNVIVMPSMLKAKKLDVYDLDGHRITSIGDIRSMDYPTYVIKQGKIYADERRRIYRLRHANDINNYNTAGYWAGLLLWKI
jgi:hypothetical protein